MKANSKADNHEDHEEKERKRHFGLRPRTDPADVEGLHQEIRLFFVLFVSFVVQAF